MNSPSIRKLYSRRIALSVGIGLLIGVAITEIPIFLLHQATRGPRQVVLTIPDGTAEQVARGEQPPSIPQNMEFVVGDMLVVNNQDSVDHKLGSLWIPAHASARLSLEEKENLSYECSFQPGNYLGMQVRDPLTLTTHVAGVLGTGGPLAVLIALYSLVLPSKKENAAS